MEARFIRFGEIEVGGVRYDYDVVIDGGKIRKRQKKSSKLHIDQFGHTPLSAAEDIPWGGGLARRTKSRRLSPPFCERTAEPWMLGTPAMCRAWTTTMRS